MTQTMGWGLASALLTLILGTVAPGVAVTGDGVEVVDLSELADGETRTFGPADRAVTATRDGDTVEIKLPDGDDGGRTLDCRLDGGSCQLIVSLDGSRTKLVALHEGDAGTTEKNVEVIVRRIGDGDDAGSLVFLGEAMSVASGGPDADVRVLTLGDGSGFVHGVHSGDGEFRWVSLEGGTVLRCPEGDTTMHLEDEDDLSTYYCPKHNVALEKVESENRFIHRIVIDKSEHAEE